ncbi:hypothetical protein Tco_0155983 [Tanacetum coccineum]
MLVLLLGVNIRLNRVRDLQLVDSFRPKISHQVALLKLSNVVIKFGITQSTPAEGDEKKKARLFKFGSASTPDPLEEEKKKARALRFAGTKGNGNGKTEHKATTVAGNAGAEA